MLLVSLCFVLCNLQQKSHPMLSRTCARPRTITDFHMHVYLGFLCFYICVWDPPQGSGGPFLTRSFFFFGKIISKKEILSCYLPLVAGVELRSY